MGRKSSDPSAIIMLVLIVVALIAAVVIFLFSVVVIATPILILSVYIFCSIKARKIVTVENAEYSDYWIGEESKNRFVSLSRENEILRNEINKCEERIREVCRIADENNISKNLDGMYSRRSNLGKKIVAQLEGIDEEMRIIKNRIRVNDSNLLEIINYPQDKWYSDFCRLKEKDMYSRYKKSSLICFTLWVISFGFCYFYFSNMKYKGGEILSYSSVISAIISAILYGLLYLLNKYKNEKFSMRIPSPPKVTLDNYNQY